MGDKLLGTPSIKEISLAQKFKSNDAVKEFCDFQTRRRCPVPNCMKLHFKKIIKPHTQEHLGDCSFLNNCFNHDSCRAASANDRLFFTYVILIWRIFILNKMSGRRLVLT